jgi:hypothetical protein
MSDTVTWSEKIINIIDLWKIEAVPDTLSETASYSKMVDEASYFC